MQRAVGVPLLPFLLLAPALLLAGCSDEAPPGEPPLSTAPTTDPPVATPDVPATDGGPSPQPIRFSLAECTNFGGVFPVPMDAAEAVLPPGFTAVPAAATTDPTGGAVLYVLGLRCAGSSVDGADTGAVDLAYAELAVVPSDEHKVAGVDDCTMPLMVVASNPAVGDALARLGLGLAGPGDVGWAEHSGLGDLIVSGALGATSVTLRGAFGPEPPTELGSGDFVVYGVQGGQVVSTVLASSRGGAAVTAGVTLEAAGDDVLAAARPATRGFSVSGFSQDFEQVLPPAAPSPPSP